MNRYRLKALWGFMSGARMYYLIAVASSLLTECFAFAMPLIISNTVDYGLNGKPLRAPAFIAQWIEGLGGAPMLARNLWIPGVLLVCVMLLQGVFMFLRGRTVSMGAETVARSMRNRLYDHLQRLPYDYHVKAETGDLIQRSTTDVETVRRFFSAQFIQAVRMIVMLALALGILLSIHPLMTLYSLALIPFIVASCMWFFKRIQKQFAVVEEADGHLSTVMQENLTGVRVVRAFGRERFELAKFSVANRDIRDKSIRLTRFFAFFWSSSDMIVIIQQLVTLLVGVWYAASGAITLGDYIVFNSYVGMLLWPVRQFGRVLSDMGRMLIAMGRIDEVLKTPAEDSGDDPQAPPIDRDIVFDRVTFGYDDKEPVLRELSFTVKAGETVALLGTTGSGKSTIMHLMQRLYDADEGRITIGGVDIRRIDKAHLRRRVGIVLQEPFLYSRTIRENIGITKDSICDEEVADAARVACLHDVVEEFEKGYDTLVGERGVTLSGGQKQRVAIARTIIRDCDVLIFDDSLSAVDTHTDAIIRSELRRRRKGITTFIISHRISTLKEADRILVLEDGRLTQQGTHEELINTDGLYRRVWSLQASLEADMEREAISV
ncbi:MAG: ABC transporter ATP-binding protein [Clostridiales bacterium]|nr:ABC transporter ATP-binding protein [Clostridiales bacterium]